MSDLQQHISFVAGVQENSVVNVALTENEHEAVRARVVSVRPDGFTVELADGGAPVFVTAVAAPEPRAPAVAAQELAARAHRPASPERS